MLRELGLQKAAATMIGGGGLRGVSGGERKRTSIGCEIVHQPSLLFLDEPTRSGDLIAQFALVPIALISSVPASRIAVAWTPPQHFKSSRSCDSLRRRAARSC